MTILWANVFPFPDPFTNFDKLCFLASLGAIICRVLPENLSFHLRRRLPIQQRPPSLSFTPNAQRMNCCGCLCRTCSHDTDSVLLLSQHRVISKQIKYLFIMMLCAVCASILIGFSLLNVGAEVLFDKLQLLFCFRRQLQRFPNEICLSNSTILLSLLMIVIRYCLLVFAYF